VDVDGPHGKGERIAPLRGSFGPSDKTDESIGLLPASLAAEASSIVILVRGIVVDFS